MILVLLGIMTMAVVALLVLDKKSPPIGRRIRQRFRAVPVGIALASSSC